MSQYKGGSKHFDKADYEWVLLIIEAKRLNIKIEDIRSFFKKKKLSKCR